MGDMRLKVMATASDNTVWQWSYSFGAYGWDRILSYPSGTLVGGAVTSW